MFQEITKNRKKIQEFFHDSHTSVYSIMDFGPTQPFATKKLHLSSFPIFSHLSSQILSNCKEGHSLNPAPSRIQPTTGNPPISWAEKSHQLLSWGGVHFTHSNLKNQLMKFPLLAGRIHSRWLFGISSINRIMNPAQLMNNCWFGARWFGIPIWVPLRIPIPFIGGSQIFKPPGPKPTII